MENRQSRRINRRAHPLATTTAVAVNVTVEIETIRAILIAVANARARNTAVDIRVTTTLTNLVAAVGASGRRAVNLKTAKAVVVSELEETSQVHLIRLLLVLPLRRPHRGHHHQTQVTPRQVQTQIKFPSCMSPIPQSFKACIHKTLDQVLSLLTLFNSKSLLFLKKSHFFPKNNNYQNFNIHNRL